MSAASTGFSHLDEFERKLAEMESELDHDVEESRAVDDGRPGSALRRGAGEWDLSAGTARAGNESFQEVAQVVKLLSRESYWSIRRISRTHSL